MSKIHINSKGEPGVCRAVSKPCPFGSEDTHFSSVAEAEEAYAKAQELMGNVSLGKSKLGNNGENVLTLSSEEEALKIANLLENEGKTSAISIITVRHALNRPKREDYESDEDHFWDEDHFSDTSRQGVGEFSDDPSIYQLRAFNSANEALEVGSSIDWNDKDLVPPSQANREHLEWIEESKADWNDVSEELLERFRDLYSESLFIDVEDPETLDRRNNKTRWIYTAPINYDHKSAILKELKVYFIPELPEE